MPRREFPKSVKVARIKHATRDGVIYCEECGLPAKRIHIDHSNPDGLTGKPVFENARVLCLPCHAAKTKDDKGNIAKAKRREAKHIGAVQPKGEIKSAGFTPRPKQLKASKPLTKTCAGVPAIARQYLERR